MYIAKIREEIQGWRRIITLRKIIIMSAIEDSPKTFQEIEKKTEMQTGTLHGHLTALMTLSIIKREKDGVYKYELTEVGINWLAIINHTDLIVKAKHNSKSQ